ncbi:MAG: hypothetical protein ACI95S_000344 [Dinoroseobacter sp.]|jgi:hypothetical protein
MTTLLSQKLPKLFSMLLVGVFAASLGPTPSYGEDIHMGRIHPECVAILDSGGAIGPGCCNFGVNPDPGCKVTPDTAWAGIGPGCCLMEGQANSSPIDNDLPELPCPEGTSCGDG